MADFPLTLSEVQSAVMSDRTSRRAKSGFATRLQQRGRLSNERHRLRRQASPWLKDPRPLGVEMLKRALHAPDFRWPRPDHRSDIAPSGCRLADLSDDLARRL